MKTVSVFLIIALLLAAVSCGSSDNRFGLTVDEHILATQNAAKYMAFPLDTDEISPESDPVSEELTYYIASGEEKPLYVVNISTRKFHLFDCTSIKSANIKNRADFYGTYDEALSVGLKPCTRCKP